MCIINMGNLYTFTKCDQTATLTSVRNTLKKFKLMRKDELFQRKYTNLNMF